MKDRSLFRRVWGWLSIPMSVLGLLSLSDSLINFNQHISNLISSYRDIVYPLFEMLFSWLWFKVPNLIIDYIFIGFLMATCWFRATGLGKVSITEDDSESRTILISEAFSWKLLRKVGVIKTLLFLLYLIGSILARGALYIILWPLHIHEATYMYLWTDKEGMVKRSPNKIQYLQKERDTLFFNYIGTIFLLFFLILVINFSFYMAP